MTEARKEGRNCLDAWVRLLELAEKHAAAGDQAGNEDDLEPQERRVHRAEQEGAEAVSRAAEP